MIVRLLALAAVLLTAILLETVVFADLTVAGAVPGVVALTVVGVALGSGSESGARYGFVAGLLVDLLAGGLVGVHMMIFTLAGWVVGAVRTYLAGPPALLHALVGGLAAAGAVVVHGLLSFVLDPGAVAAGSLLRTALVTGIYSALLAPLFAGGTAALLRRADAVAAGAGR